MKRGGDLDEPLENATRIYVALFAPRLFPRLVRVPVASRVVKARAAQERALVDAVAAVGARAQCRISIAGGGASASVAGSVGAPSAWFGLY